MGKTRSFHPNPPPAPESRDVPLPLKLPGVVFPLQIRGDFGLKKPQKIGVGRRRDGGFGRFPRRGIRSRARRLSWRFWGKKKVFIPKNQRGLLEPASLWKSSPRFPRSSCFFPDLSPGRGDPGGSRNFRGVPEKLQTWEISPQSGFFPIHGKTRGKRVGKPLHRAPEFPLRHCFFGILSRFPRAGREPDPCSSFPRRNGAGKGFWGVLG